MTSLMKSSLIFSIFTMLSFGLFADSDVEIITAEDMLKRRDNFIVLDVRSEKEYQQGHIESAINIPHDEIDQHLKKLGLLAKDKTIVVHCRSGYRAGKAEKILLENKISNIKHLEGDMLLWQKQNRPLVTVPE